MWSKEFNSTIVENNQILIYPNPAQDKVNIQFNSDDMYDLKLYDLKGKEVYNASGIRNHSSIETKNLPAGIFVIVLQSKNHMYKEKIVIIR